MDPDELDHLVVVAEEAARVGAAVVARSARDRGLGQAEPAAEPERKGPGDYVTAVDRESEMTIRRYLDSATPDVPVFAEEGGGQKGSRYWAVDPLDATTNFLIGFPVVAVSVALLVDGRPVVGAIRAPLLGVEFAAARGRGARSGSSKLRVSDRPPERAIVATALPFRKKHLLPRYLPVLDSVFARIEDVRRAGAAALDLAWVAAGVFDGYFELGMSVWDVAAGALMVEEAGGVVSDWEGGPAYLGGDIMAGSPLTHRVLVEEARGSADR